MSSKPRRPLGQRIIRRVVFTLGGLVGLFIVLAIIGAIVGPRPTPTADTSAAPAPAPSSVAAVPPAPAPVVAPPPAPAPVVAPAPAPVGDVQPVTRVVDGDTFVTPEGKVRVMVMDACESDTSGGAAATAEAHQLLDGQSVTLTAEPGHDTDRYGRLLRYVTLPGGRDYADTMLEATHTAVYAGHNDASEARVAEGRVHDPNGRACGDEQTTVAPAPAPTYDAPYVNEPKTHVPAAPKVHTGHTGHLCVGGERDGDGDGYCGEGK